jgi:hypothetical protein
MRSNPLITFVLLVFLLLSFHALYAATTGKISGVITDVETKEPLIGVNVIVDGTHMGAATDIKGRYVVINVPPGSYTLRAEMLGYKKVRIEDVRVSIDFTTRQDIAMAVTVLDAGEEVVVTAERPLIQKDMTSSLAAVAADEISDMPVQSIDAVVNLQAGVVNEGGLHIRGGRSGEVVQWVDGLDMTTYGGGRGVDVEKDVVQELQVISGTFNAEYGRAMSGVINVVTKDGEADRYRGSLKTYGSTEYSNFDKYYFLKSYDHTYNEESGEYIPSEDRYYYNRKLRVNAYHVEGQLSGPVPLTNKKVSFISNFRLNEDRGNVGIRWFHPNGMVGDSAIVNYGGGTSWSSFNKFSYSLTNSAKLKYTLFFDGYDSNRGGSRYIPESGNLSRNNSMTHMVSFNHVLSPTTFYEVRIASNSSSSESYRYKNWENSVPNYLIQIDDPLSSLVSGSAPEYLQELIANNQNVFDPDDETAALMLGYLQDYGFQYSWIVDPNDSEGYVHPDTNSVAQAPYSIDRTSMSHSINHSSSSFLSAKIDLNSQVNKMNYLKLGFDIKQYKVDYEGFSLIPATDEAGTQIVPFVPSKPDPESSAFTQYDRNPYEFSAYIQDKIEFREITLNIGLRYDYFHANSVIPADPRDPDIYFPFKNVYKYKDYQDPDANLSADWSQEDWDAYFASHEEYTPDERREFMHKKVGGKSQLSPRLGVAFPISDKGVIHFSYGHFFQRPSFSQLFDSPDFKIGKELRALIGNADLNAEQTIQYEVGVQQQIGQIIGLDVTVFYKDIRNWISSSPLIETDDIYLRYSKLVNKDFANVKGVTAKLESRFSRDVGARINYTYQIAEGINNAPSDAFNAITNNIQPRNYLIPMSYDLRHNFNASLQARKWDWLASLIWTYRTGFPYTPEAPRGESIGGSAFVGWRQNSEYRPVITNVDLRLEREFKTKRFSHLFYVYVYNLFDQKGEENVYSDTGTARYTTQLDKDNIGYDPDRIGTVDYYIDQNNVGFYQSAREIEFGYSFRF